MTTRDLETPALLLDLDAMERNHKRIMDYLTTASAALRPHTKTHRTPALAQWQIEHGARGICCGNLGEAEVMIAAGIRDVLVTKEIVQPQQIARVAELARDSEIIVVVDDAGVVGCFAGVAQRAGVQIRVMVEVDIRLGRAGVQPGEPARALARQVDAARGLRFVGLMGYDGSMHNLDAVERAEQCRLALEKLVATKELIERDGIAVNIVSSGATSTFKTAGSFPGVTEVQAGSYFTGDARYLAEWSDFECALSVLTTVISRPNARRVTIDAGQKKLSSDAGLPLVKNRDGERLMALNEEHGILDAYQSAQSLRVGDQIEVLPSHGGTTITLYDKLYGVRGERVETVFEIKGQGK